MQTRQPRRPRGEAKVSRRRDGRYWTRLELPPVGGRRRRRQGIFGNSPAEVRRKRAAFLERHAAGMRLPRPGTGITIPRLSLADLLQRWLTAIDAGRPTRYRPQGIVPSSWISYEGHVRLHISPYLGATNADALTVLDVEAWLEQLRVDGRSRALRSKVLTTLRIALGWAVDRDLLSRNAAGAAPSPGHERKFPEPISLADIEAILDAVADHRLGVLFTLAELLGPRLGEILALKWDEDFDAEARTLTFNHTLSWATGVAERKQVKTPKSRRTVALPETLFEGLLAHRERQRLERAAAGETWVDGGYIFTRRHGRPLRGDGSGGVGDQFKRCLRRAGLRVRNFHQLRHQAASMLLVLNGGNLVEVQYILGHSTYRMTADLYGHQVQEAGAQLAAKVEQFLRSHRSRGQ